MFFTQGMILSNLGGNDDSSGAEQAKHRNRLNISSGIVGIPSAQCLEKDALGHAELLSHGCVGEDFPSCLAGGSQDLLCCWGAVKGALGRQIWGRFLGSDLPGTSSLLQGCS